jgi:hypothetical protein
MSTCLALKSREHQMILINDDLDLLDYSNDRYLEEQLRALFILLKTKELDVKTLIITEGHSKMILYEVGLENTVDASMGPGTDGFLCFEMIDGQQSLEL